METEAEERRQRELQGREAVREVLAIERGIQAAKEKLEDLEKARLERSERKEEKEVELLLEEKIQELEKKKMEKV